MKPNKFLLRLVLVLLTMYIAILMLTSCEEVSMSPVSSAQVTININANVAECMPSDYVVIVLIDKDDKLSVDQSFNCRTFSITVPADAGDLIEVRMWSNSKSFNKSILYDIEFIQNGITQHVSDDVRYTGSKYTVK